MTLASGVAKRLVLAAQSDLQTIAAAGDSDAAYIRRVESTVALTRDAYESNEKRSDFQVADMRLGTKRVGGAINGEISPTSYEKLIEAVLRRDFSAGVVWTAQATDGLTSAVSGSNRTFTRAAGTGTDFLATGIRVGDVFRVGNTGDANASFNFRAIDVTANVITAAGTSGANIVSADEDATITVIGKKSFIPLTGHTSKAFSLEHNFSDVDYSEVFKLRFGTWRLSVPAQGLITTGFDVMGTDMTQFEGGDAPYFTSVAAAPTTGTLAAANGSLRYNDGTTAEDIAIVTQFDMTLDLGLSGDPVVGSDILPEIFYGRSRLSGSLSAYLADSTLTTSFLTETELELQILFEVAGTAPRHFLSVFLPRVKLSSADKGDSEQGIIQNFNWVALLQNDSGTKYDQTTVVVQDSTLS